MTLPSQSYSSSSGRRYMSSHRRPHAKWPVITAIGCLIVAIMYFWLWHDSNARTVEAQEEIRAQREDSVSTSLDTAEPDSAELTAASPTAPAPLEMPPAAATKTVTAPIERPPPPDEAPLETKPALPEPPPAGTPASASSTTGGLDETTVQKGMTPQAPRSQNMARGMQLIEQGKPIEARKVLSTLLLGPGTKLSFDEQHRVRASLRQVNAKLFFSPDVLPDDSLTIRYTVKRGDTLSRIAPRFKTTFELLAQINRIHPDRLRAGQHLKSIQGPLHAVVSKSLFRMDVFAREDGSPLFIESFRVGLGEDDSTPAGQWIVETGRKLKNPPWHNPRTGEFFSADDPTNPIGERWIGLKGTGERTRQLKGYGIHGTLHPDSIGRMQSMGCIRLVSKDIKLLYKLLTEGSSTVVIEP